MDIITLVRLIIGAGAAFLIGATLVVAFGYAKAWKKRGLTSVKGLLPMHVFTVALSYNLLLVYVAVTTIERANQHLPLVWWRLATLIPAIALGFVAMHAVSKLHRKSRLKED